ncbi:MAG: hypothetical protein ACK5NY_02450 [Burkholderiaceae bacterium]|jgi:hypothetical protein
MTNGHFLIEALIYLSAAVIAVPVSKRLRRALQAQGQSACAAANAMSARLRKPDNRAAHSPGNLKENTL